MQDERVASPVQGRISLADSGPSLEARATGGIWPDGGLRAALRALRPLVGSRAIDSAGSAAPLERFAMAGDPPAVASCAMLEEFGARVANVAAAVGVDAFLDGIQRSRILGHLDGSPILFATVAAVIRQRIDRRMVTWDVPRVRHLVLASRTHLGESHWAALLATNVDPIDVSESGRDELPLHPLAVRARALDVVAQERETLERRLAAEWCRTEQRWLWIDGGISGNLAVDAASPAFGVVKSHNTLYGDVAAVRATLGLAVGERSPLFLVQHRGRRGVASWYLRVHASDDGDPLHGLVRVELAPPLSLFHAADVARDHPEPAAVRILTRRADEVSGWILAERGPIALPDPRWDTLTYGVYGCEQYLKALIG
ncbi:MAG: hypothetical protein IPP90_00095 [Gemmatimonadaceae bacterium]|nr:hypothetical protein [Gemmatimonadaceae bacterium]